MELIPSRSFTQVSDGNSQPSKKGSVVGVGVGTETTEECTTGCGERSRSMDLAYCRQESGGPLRGRVDSIRYCWYR